MYMKASSLLGCSDDRYMIMEDNHWDFVVIWRIISGNENLQWTYIYDWENRQLVTDEPVEFEK